MARPFVDALKRHSREVAQLEGGQAEEFARLLRGLQDELRGRLFGEHAAADDPLDAFRMRRILAETQAGLRVLDAKAAGFWGKAQQDAIDLALEHVADEVRLLSGGLDATPFRITLDAAKVWADPAYQLLANHFETSVQRYGADLLNDIRRRLFTGLRTGDSTADIVRDIAGKKGPLGSVGQSKAETIVRTEVSQAYGVAQHDGIAQADRKIPGGLAKMWVHVGSYLCPTCGPLHGTSRPLDGTWTIQVAKGPPAKFKKIAHPPGHPRCVPPGTLIATPSGERRIEFLRVGDVVTGGLTGAPRRVTDVHVNHYGGEVYRVRAGGREVWLTDLHPVLTLRGWVAAKELQAGDVLFRHVSNSRVLLGDGLAAPPHDAPAESDEVTIAPPVEPALALRVVPVPRVNLDIDHVLHDGDVEVVDPDGVLRNGMESGGSHLVDEHLLQLGRLTDRSDRMGATDALLDGPASPPDCGVRCLGVPPAGLDPDLSIPQHLRRRGIAPRDSVALHGGVDGGAAAPQRLRHSDYVHVVDPVHAAELLGIEFEALRHTHNLMHLPLVAMAVESISTRRYVGEVRNLSVEGDESYVAEGVVVHNCVCRVVASKPSWTAKLEKLGYLKPQPDDGEAGDAKL